MASIALGSFPSEKTSDQENTQAVQATSPPTVRFAPDQNNNQHYCSLFFQLCKVQNHTEFCLGLYKFLHNLYRSLT